MTFYLFPTLYININFVRLGLKDDYRCPEVYDFVASLIYVWDKNACKSLE